MSPTEILRSFMKRILPLLLLSTTAFADCDYKVTENVSCSENFACAEKAFKEQGAEANLEKFTEFSKAHQCQDQLKFAALVAEDEAEVNTTAKTDLPVIPDAPVRAPAAQE